MDFGDFITLILFLIFIVAPFLKRKKAKEGQKSEKSQPSRFSVLGKIKDALKEAAREMEAQAEQSRQEKENGHLAQAGEKVSNQTFWDEVDDREDEAFYFDDQDAQIIKQVEPVKEDLFSVARKKELRDKAVRISKIETSTTLTPKSPEHDDAIQTNCHRAGPRHLPARARGLQKAVIWSEILGKPVALKD